MYLLNLFKNPFFRIKSAHIGVIILLSISIVFFYHTLIVSVIELIVIIAIMLHHLDDEKIRTTLLNTESELREDKNIFDRNVMVSETNINGIVTYVNSNYLQVCGYSKEEMLGATHSLIRDKETSNDAYKLLWKELENGKIYSGIFKNRKKNGSPFWVDTHISPILSNGKKIGYKSIMFEITDKILAQEQLEHTIENKDIELKEQINRFEFVINSSRDGFWDYDLVKKEFYLSNGWKKRLGLDKKTIHYLDYLALIPDDHRFEHHKAMHDIIDTYPEYIEYVHFRIQYPLVTKNSEKLIIEDVGNIFFDKEQNPIRITGFHRDITDQERQTKIMESQNRVAAMGDMMSNVAHQWRQPIGAINNTLNDLEFDIELEDLEQIDAKLFLETSTKVKEYTAYLSQTIDDFRELTSNEKYMTTFVVFHTLKEAYKITQNEYEQASIHLNIIENNEGITEIDGYERELQQVFINILNNAKDILIEKKIVDATVNVTLLNTKENITIIIHDNAGGIPDEIILKIFDPYFTTKHESLGTGIGLYMSKNIITNYFKGTVEVENEDGGAKFTITLPKDINV